jgi:hypothetical protein
MQIFRFNMKLLYKIIILIFIIVTPIKMHSQVGTIKIEKTKPIKDTTKTTISSFDLYYGYKLFANNFQGRFNTLKNFKYNKPIQLIGGGFSGPVLISRSSPSYYMHSLFHLVIPQTIFLNDSIRCKVTGFVYSLAWGGYVNSKSGNLYTGFYLGFNTGRLRFYGNEIIRQKNPFFSPKIGVQQKVLIGKFTIGLILEAEYDISKTSWRRLTYTNKDKINIEQFRQTGVTILLGISYHFIKYAAPTNETIEHDDI